MKLQSRQFLPIILLLFVHPSTTSSATPAISPSKSPTPAAPAPKSINPTAPAPKSTNPTAPAPKSTTPAPAASASSPSSSSSSSTLDPKQLRALESLNIPTSKDPCSNPSIRNIVVCDNSKPFRHLTSLHLINCSSDVALSTTALKSLSTLKDLQFINCPLSPINFPSELISSLHSFTCINSLKKLSGVWLGKLENLTDLTVKDVSVRASGPVIVVGNLHNLKSVTLSNTNLSGNLPTHWHGNVSNIDLSANQIEGKIPGLLTSLDNLVSWNLSSNQLSGEMPTSIGDLISLKNLSLSSNSLSGSIPHGVAALPSLVHLDLSSNQFNGSIPKFLADMKSLKYLNLANNSFQGVMPFNASFIKGLTLFKISGNMNLCYNHSTLSSKLKLGIAKCDKNGFPVSPLAKSKSDEDDYSDDYNSADDTSKDDKGHHGPNKVVLGVAIGLSSIVFLIIFLILLSKWCA